MAIDINPAFEKEKGVFKNLEDRQAEFKEMRDLAQFSYGLKYDYRKDDEIDLTQKKISDTVNQNSHIELQYKIQHIKNQYTETNHKLPLARQALRKNALNLLGIKEPSPVDTTAAKNFQLRGKPA